MTGTLAVGVSYAVGEMGNQGEGASVRVVNGQPPLMPPPMLNYEDKHPSEVVPKPEPEPVEPKDTEQFIDIPNHDLAPPPEGPPDPEPPIEPYPVQPKNLPGDPIDIPIAEWPESKPAELVDDPANDSPVLPPDKPTELTGDQ